MAAPAWKAALMYGAGPTTFACAVSQRPWAHERAWEGGTIEAASGLMEAFTIRTDRVITVAVRIPEVDLEAFFLALDAGIQNPGTLTFFPNGVAGTGHLVYILSPKHGDRFVPTRGDEPSTFDVQLKLRRVDGQPWALDYYGGP